MRQAETERKIHTHSRKARNAQTVRDLERNRQGQVRDTQIRGQRGKDMQRQTDLGQLSCEHGYVDICVCPVLS